MTTFNFRPFDFSDRDYASLIAITHACFPDSAATIEREKYRDQTLKKESPTAGWLRLIAEINGEPVGIGTITHEYDVMAKNSYHLNIMVIPSQRGRGIASAFYQIAQTEFRQQHPVSAWRTTAYSTDPAALHLLEKYQFTPQNSTVESALDVVTADFSALPQLVQKFTAQGITIRPLAELMPIDPDFQQKLCDLEWIFAQDEPNDEPPAPFNLEQFAAHYLDVPTFWPDGWLIAVKDGAYVGWSAIFPVPNQPDRMHTGVTVIDRPYRRTGLATYMKLLGFKHAQSLGKKSIRTLNEATNPMLTLNKQLGFREIKIRTIYKKQLA